MRYMDELDNVVTDAVGLIRHKTATYGDSWKRRGGPGAWFTTVRPWDRLEKIVEHHAGNVFDAIRDDPEGHDGSALACVRDIMNYLILIEAHARVVLGVGRHGPARKAALVCDNCGNEYPPEAQWVDVRNQDKRFCGEVCCRRYHAESEPSPASGSHHALGEEARLDAMERAGEVTEDTRRAGGSAGRRNRRNPGDRLEAFRVGMLALAEEHEVPVECRTSALGEMLCIDIDLRKIER
jgi:hypothetical protein